jgi:AcrB/AcrD/AcrF family
MASAVAERNALQAAASSRGVQLPILQAGSDDELDEAFASLTRLRASGLVIGQDAFFIARPKQIAARALQHSVPGAQKSLAELRTIQDWYVRYGIAKAEGVAEVASVGGFVKQYSVVIDPRRLQALGIPLTRIREALRTSNMDVGGRTVELAVACAMFLPLQRVQDCRE